MEAGGECTEKIVLTDRDLETSEVLNIVLPFIADHTTDLEEWTLPCGTQVVEFLKKYDCQRELRLLSLEIYQAIYGPDTPSHGDELFVLAAWLEHWQLCNLITQKYGQWYWRRLYDGDEEDDCFGEVLWKGRMFDPRTWEDEDLAKLPADVMWAFLRASHKVDWNKKDDKEFKAMGREFVRSMGLSPSRSVLISPNGKYSIVQLIRVRTR